jgi:hypothetical protein
MLFILDKNLNFLNRALILFKFIAFLLKEDTMHDIFQDSKVIDFLLYIFNVVFHEHLLH